jgi:hypothetical protein
MNYFVNISLRLLETASTRANTEFSPWWLALNGELAKRSMREACYGDARITTRPAILRKPRQTM